MDFLQILQTIGICVGALALVVIAISLITISAAFTPPPDTVVEEDFDANEVLELQRMLEEHEKLRNVRPLKRRSTPKKQPKDRDSST
ncbi:MAG: hypothetical protein IAE83_22055 [Anaerolinea sp.]|nr:hypothetical protein [Anaerolinea sp.]CAG1007162.1 hypothetical protein ANRL4_03711 [Anaerolineae bacterium]